MDFTFHRDGIPVHLHLYPLGVALAVVFAGATACVALRSGRWLWRSFQSR